MGNTAKQSILYINVYINRHIDYDIYDIKIRLNMRGKEDARGSFYRYVVLFSFAE